MGYEKVLDDLIIKQDKRYKTERIKVFESLSNLNLLKQNRFEINFSFIIVIQ